MLSQSLEGGGASRSAAERRINVRVIEPNQTCIYNIILVTGDLQKKNEERKRKLEARLFHVLTSPFLDFQANLENLLCKIRRFKFLDPFPSFKVVCRADSRDRFTCFIHGLRPETVVKRPYDSFLIGGMCLIPRLPRFTFCKIKRRKEKNKSGYLNSPPRVRAGPHLSNAFFKSRTFM